MQAGNIILKPGAAESGKILKVEITNDENGKRKIKATGRFLSYILKKHLIKSNFSFNGKASDAMRKLVDATVINGQADDKIAGLMLDTEADTTAATFDGVIKKYTDLYDALVAIAYASGVGFKITLDAINDKYIFSCYEAKDHSIYQSVNPVIEFSQEYENVGESDYIIDSDTEINAVVAEYSGDMENVIVNVNPTSATGDDKKEIHITGECVTGKAYRLTDAGELEEYDIIDTTETEKSLRVLALSALVEKSETFTAAVDLDSKTTIYKTDYDLGDIVTITDDSINRSLTQRIFEIAEIDDESGHDLTPVFGSRYPIIMNILKK